MKVVREWILENEEAWGAVVAQVLPLLGPSTWVALHGDLGVGKTFFVRRLLKELGETGPIPSPSYPLMLEYILGDRRVCHLDAYRLDPRHESPWTEELLEGALVLVEWPLKSALPSERFHYEMLIERVDDESEKRKVIWKSL
jgi:tRNA threonylcarbamoyladenosine biosynthesis protein TsaE